MIFNFISKVSILGYIVQLILEYIVQPVLGYIVQ
jgi:hypothetical protein